MGRLDEVLEMTGTVGLFMDISGTKVMRIDTKNSQPTGIGEETKETVDTFRPFYVNKWRMILGIALIKATPFSVLSTEYGDQSIFLEVLESEWTRIRPYY